MLWLVSGAEPESLYAPILTEERLRAGAVRELVKLLPWYKRTLQMEPTLALHLTSVLRSGFERSYLLRQLESLDIPADAAERFLSALEDDGACRFAEPGLYYNQVIHAAAYEKGVVVQGQYMKNRLVVSETLARCLRLLDGFMPAAEYQRLLSVQLGGEEYARRACQSLARQGLILGCDSARPATLDHGPLRWNIEITDGARLIDDGEWERRLRFVEDSFRAFYFQSRNLFPAPPVQLWGDLRAVTEAGVDYFWQLYFKLQKFGATVPVNLRLTTPPPEIDLQEFGRQAPSLFTWNLVADVRGGGAQSVKEVCEKFGARRPAGRGTLTLLAGREVPVGLAHVCESAYVKLYFNERPEPATDPGLPLKFRRAVHRACKPHMRREGCGALLSPYVDASGAVYACALEGAAGLGHIENGARAVEQRRRELLRESKGACSFGLNPRASRECGRGEGLPQACREDAAAEWTLQAFNCP
jgi:hypothetical protein